MSMFPVVVTAITDHTAHNLSPCHETVRAAAMVMAATFIRTGGLAQQVTAGVEWAVHYYVEMPR